MENYTLFDVILPLIVLVTYVRNIVEVRRLRRENGKLRALLAEKRELGTDEFWKRYRDTAPKM